MTAKSPKLWLFQPMAKDFWSSREASYSLQGHCWAMHLQLLTGLGAWHWDEASTQHCTEIAAHVMCSAQGVMDSLSAPFSHHSQLPPKKALKLNVTFF